LKKSALNLKNQLLLGYKFGIKLDSIKAETELLLITTVTQGATSILKGARGFQMVYSN
jgi:hypothetical protein